MINILNKTIPELKQSLCDLIKEDYDNGFKVTSISIYEKIKSQLDTRYAIYRSGPYGEFWIKSNNADICVYVVMDFLTGKNKANMRITSAQLEINLCTYNLADTSFKQPKIAIVKDTSKREVKIDILKDYKECSIAEIINNLEIESSELYRQYKDELNNQKIQGLVKHIMIMDKGKKKLFESMLGEEMAVRFNSEPFKGAVANYIVDNLIVEVTEEEAKEIEEAEIKKKELREKKSEAEEQILKILTELDTDKLSKAELLSLSKLLMIKSYFLISQLSREEED